jgi:hypothetical protein
MSANGSDGDDKDSWDSPDSRLRGFVVGKTDRLDEVFALPYGEERMAKLHEVLQEELAKAKEYAEIRLREILDQELDQKLDQELDQRDQED